MSGRCFYAVKTLCALTNAGKRWLHAAGSCWQKSNVFASTNDWHAVLCRVRVWSCVGAKGEHVKLLSGALSPRT